MTFIANISDTRDHYYNSLLSENEARNVKYLHGALYWNDKDENEQVTLERKDYMFFKK